MSGISITPPSVGATVETGEITDGAVTNAKVNAAAAIAYSKLATLATGQVVAGNANVPTATTLSGDVTVGATGTTAIGAGKVTLAQLASANVDATLPWRVDLTPDTAAASATVGTWTAYDQASSYNTTHAQNDAVSWEVVLAAGTWNLYVLCGTNPAYGIITAKIDGSSVGTMDTYAAGNNINQQKSITGITVASTGKKTLQFVVATKNASSSDYYMLLSWITLRRTA